MKKQKIVIKRLSSNLKCAEIGVNNHSNIKKSDFRLYATKKVKKKDRLKKLWLVIGGSIIGLLNGFFGGGGGMVAVPILERVLKLESKDAHATAIAVIFPLSLISASIYVFNNFVESFSLIYVTIGVVIGGVLGAFILKFLPPKIVKILFSLIMLIGGVKLIL